MWINFNGVDMGKKICSLLILLGCTAVFSLFIQSNGNTFAEETPWHTYIVVGDYGYSDPPKPNNFFIIKYRTINGSTNAFNVEDRTFIAKVNSEKSALFEIKIPRNYPYTNIYEVPEDFFGISSNGIILNSGYEVKKTECFFSYSIQFSGNQTIQLYYTQYPAGIPFHGDDIPQSCMTETIFLDPPLKQFKSGITTDKITCKEGLNLVIKSSDGSPACVKHETKSKLVERGWAKSQS